MTFFWLTVLESVKWAAVWFGLNAHLQDTEPRFHLIESPLITLLGSKTKLSDRIEGIKYSPVLHSEPQFFIEMTTNVHKTTLDQYVWPPLHRPQFTKQTLKVVLQSTGAICYTLLMPVFWHSPQGGHSYRETLVTYHKTVTLSQNTDRFAQRGLRFHPDCVSTQGCASCCKKTRLFTVWMEQRGHQETTMAAMTQIN